MPKNLVILHLESVSQSSLWQFMDELPALWKLSERSANFRRFFANSTSSVMSMCDMMHGDSSELDHNPRFPRNKTSLLGRSSNLFRILRERGYLTCGLQYGSFCLGDAPNSFWGIWPDECGPFPRHNRLDDFHRASRDFIAEAKNGNKPFALYYWSMATHIRNDVEEGGDALAFAERFRAGYRTLNESVANLLSYLEDAGVLENTLIAVFGDHGDDFWRHGFCKGRTHVIEPYSNLCWTPFFLYNNDRDIGIFDLLASIVDIKATVLRILFPDLPPEERTSPFAGVDLALQKRDLAFGQSIFALQLEHSDPVQAVSKSYAVTNGDLRLMASSGGGNMKEEGGMELFLEQWDFGGTRNLLDFIELDENGKVTTFDFHGAVHPHFTMSFTEPRVVNMVESYAGLRQILADYVRLKEQEALKHSGANEFQLFPMEAFTIKRRKRW